MGNTFSHNANENLMWELITSVKDRIYNKKNKAAYLQNAFKNQSFEMQESTRMNKTKILSSLALFFNLYNGLFICPKQETATQRDIGVGL